MINDRGSNKQSPSQNAGLVKSRRKSRTPVKKTATEAHLSAIHKKVLFHFRGQNMMSQCELRRIKLIIKRMECSLPREHKIWKTVQNMLAKINNRKRATTTNKNVTKNPEYPSTDSNLFTTNESATLIEEKENVPSNSQTSSLHAMKLRSHNTQNDESSLSFPLELLTNVNFEDTQKSAASADTENGKKYTHIFNEELELIIQGNCPVEINSNNNNTSRINIIQNISLGARIENSQIISQCSINTMGSLGVITPSTPEDNTPSVLEIQDTPTDSATQTSNCEYIEMPSQGTWEAANIRISEETEYDFDETNVPEIIVVDGDDDDLGNNNFTMDDGENECFEFRETDATLCSVNISNNDPLEMTMCNERVESESFEFNLKENESNTVIEDTPIAKHYRNQSASQEVELVVPNETPLIEPLSKLSIINASQKNTVDETQYANSESAIFKTNTPIRRHGGPYKRRSQSTSCLNYKANGKSSSSLNKRLSFVNNESHFVDDEIDSRMPNATPNQLFSSENLMLINGSIHQMGTVANTPEEEPSFSDKQKKLKEEVMKKRNKYEHKWKDMPISEKVSAKFADKFHIRIFDDPVESLTDIGYSPNFDNFNYPRLSTKQMHEQMMASYEMTLKMDAALVKVVGECAETNDGESTFVLPRNSADGSDSDSSDEEGASNRKWLRDHMANTKHDMKDFMKLHEMYKKQCEEHSGTIPCINNNNNNKQRENQDSDELLEGLLKKMGDCDWIEDQND